MLNKVSDYIKQNNLIEEGDRIVLGVSGGADSISLLHILHELYRSQTVKLIVVHVNHGLRDKEAEKDEQFVQTFAERIGVTCHVFHYKVKQVAKEEGLSEEEAGRKLRYQAFQEVCQKYGCNKIAIAHNKNDNAETVLFHLFRGSGIKGLTGISSNRTLVTDAGKVTVIRPLLFVSREEIEAYLSKNHIMYRVDLTNLKNDYSRNKIRNEVLTYVTREINQNAVDHIVGAAGRLSEAEKYIATQVSKRYSVLVQERVAAYEFTISEIQKEDIVIQKGIILQLLEKLAGSRKDIETKHVEEVLTLYHKQVGKHIHLPYGIIVLRNYYSIRFFKVEDAVAKNNKPGPMQPLVLEIPGRIYLKQQKKVLETMLIPYEKGMLIPKNSCTKWLDYDKIENAVEIRTRKEGDFIQINPQGGRKKIKDYFIDRKVPREERSFQLLIADGSHIMWVLGDGERMSEKYKISENTERILLINLYDSEEKEDDR